MRIRVGALQCGVVQCGAEYVVVHCIVCDAMGWVLVAVVISRDSSGSSLVCRRPRGWRWSEYRHQAPKTKDRTG